MLKSYGVRQMKKMYGKAYLGVVRSTVLVDPAGRAARVWERIQVKDPAAAVREELQRVRNGWGRH